jgi:hypothetical protein
MEPPFPAILIFIPTILTSVHCIPPTALHCARLCGPAPSRLDRTRSTRKISRITTSGYALLV